MKRTVTVTGQGVSRVVPDTAVVRVAAVHRAEGVAQACAGVASAVAAMSTVAREHTEAARIASADFNVWPAHDHEGRQQGFEARHGLTIGVADITAAGGLLTALADVVGDRLQVEGVSLQVAESGPALVSAREAAFADARTRAEALAALSGAGLGDVVTVLEGGGHHYAEARPMAMAAGAAKDIAFEPGEQSLAASVTVTWQLV